MPTLFERGAAWADMPALRFAIAGDTERHINAGLGGARRALDTSIQLGRPAHRTAGRPAEGAADCRLPAAAFFTAALVFCLAFFDDIYGVPPPTLLLLFLGLVILVTGYQALQRVRDLASGVALVQEDVLQRLRRPRRGSGKYGTFEQLGTLRLRQRAYFHGQPSRRHRVVYSPASKIAWALEPLD